MVLPPGVNKATGLLAALQAFGISPCNVVGVGDGENDQAVLGICECAVAVANALPMVKQRSDFVTSEGHGAGVVELIEALLSTELAEVEPRLRRHDVPIGTRDDGGAVTLPSHNLVVPIAGPAASGKSTMALGLMERLAQRAHQICVVDPEGD